MPKVHARKVKARRKTPAKASAQGSLARRLRAAEAEIVRLRAQLVQVAVSQSTMCTCNGYPDNWLNR